MRAIENIETYGHQTLSIRHLARLDVDIIGEQPRKAGRVSSHWAPQALSKRRIEAEVSERLKTMQMILGASNCILPNLWGILLALSHSHRPVAP